MNLFTVVNLLRVSILLFISAASFALILLKWHKLCNIVSNIICITASIFGISGSLIHLLTGGEKIMLAAIKPVIPLLSFDLALDRLSAFFVLGLCVLVLCVSIYSIGYVSHYYGKRNVGLFNFLYSTFILSMFFVITSANAVFFFIAWEAMSMLSYFLVVFESEKGENQKAGTLYIIMTHVATAFLLIAFMIMFSYTKSFDLFGSAAAIPPAARNVMFLLLLVGFGTKAGVIPVHIWLPYAHPAAPSNVSALMSGIMIKTAIYGLVRFVLCYLKVEDTWWGIAILCIGAVSAVLGVAYALMEHNIKRLLAFHSVENIGIILIGLGVSFMAFSQNNGFLGSAALAASLLHTFNHMLFKGGLFLGAGSIQYATHTKDIEKLGGLIKKMPVTAFLVLCFSLAISAIVPFNGFISEWLTYQSLFMNISAGHAAQNILSILSAAALGMAGALAAYCFVKLFGISFLGLPRSSQASEAKEVPAAMNVGMGILAALCLFIGLLPTLFLKVLDSVVSGISGVSILEKLQGGFVIAWYPLQVSGNSISPLELLIALAAITAVTLLVLRLIGGKYSERKYGTWDCGYEALNPRMQYTATGFSKPIRIVFRALYRAGREVGTEEGKSPYFPASIKYKVTTESIFENYLYKPLIDMVKNFSRKIKFTVQTGSIHAYLIYIFLAVLVLMVYNRLA
jgi:hydrogenase-4 component B